MSETKRSDNLALWNAVRTPDAERVKGFSRPGGFSGTAINATYLFKRATEMFGPAGIGWGYEIEDEKLVAGHPLTTGPHGEVLAQVHVLRVRFWYQYQGKRGEIVTFGQTTMVGKTKNGLFTDEEAPKKSLTDALSKALSMLGFAADVHMGLWDDNKYVAEVKAEQRKEKAKAARKSKQADPLVDAARQVYRQLYRELLEAYVDEKAAKRVAWETIQDVAASHPDASVADLVSAGVAVLIEEMGFGQAEVLEA